jgi:hypothetical protein
MHFGIDPTDPIARYPIVRDGQCRTGKEIEDSTFWFALFVVASVVVGVIALGALCESGGCRSTQSQDRESQIEPWAY